MRCKHLIFSDKLFILDHLIPDEVLENKANEIGLTIGRNVVGCRFLLNPITHAKAVDYAFATRLDMHAFLQHAIEDKAAYKDKWSIGQSINTWLNEEHGFGR